MKQYLQRKTLTIGNLTISSKDLNIDFEVPFDDDPDPNESIITVYNLSEDTINRIKRDQPLSLLVGYEGDEGVILTGRVSKSQTRFDGPDKRTEVYVIDGAKLDDKKTVKKTYKKNIRASQVINDLLPKLGLPVAALRLPKDKTYASGLSVNGSIANKINELCRDCGASFYISRGKIYIRSIKEGDDIKFKLSSETGLIENPTPFEEENDGKIIRGYHVSCLLQHRITTGSIIEISSKTVKGKFRVRNGNHIAADTDFFTEMDVLI
ncbi:hypothetical protein ACFCW7_23250 [Paenibacillus glucanolyticus]|uniref:phage protein n=1 Tax=Paenibacillus glucanolyticus TaxID=59843 RepID=UPI0035D846EC